MLKELFIAIILGGLLGFGVTGGLISLNRKQGQPAPPITTPTPPPAVPTGATATAIPTVKPDSEPNFKITSPANGSVVNQNKVKLSGNAPANSLVIAALNNQSFTTKSLSDGSFELTITIETGYNLIAVSAVDPNDNLTQIEINLTYSTAQF